MLNFESQGQNLFERRASYETVKEVYINENVLLMPLLQKCYIYINLLHIMIHVYHKDIELLKPGAPLLVVACFSMVYRIIKS